MADLQTLRDLRERVRKATGADRELDARIWAEFDNRDVVVNTTGPMTARARTAPHDECMLMFDGKLLPRAPVTGSINAAIALVERVLPGCYRTSGSGRLKPSEPLYGCAIYEPIEGEPIEIGGGQSEHSEPLAILDALLSALISIEESKQGEGGDG